MVEICGGPQTSRFGFLWVPNQANDNVCLCVACFQLADVVRDVQKTDECHVLRRWLPLGYQSRSSTPAETLLDRRESKKRPILAASVGWFNKIPVTYVAVGQNPVVYSVYLADNSRHGDVASTTL